MGGRDQTRPERVSIHAPTGGATLLALVTLGIKTWRVSIHAPTGGATCSQPLSRKRRLGFNPRAHGGRD